MTTLEELLKIMLAQNNEKGKENDLHNISQCLKGAEVKYSPIKKQCSALILVTQKLHHYMLLHKMTLNSKVNPLKFLMTRPTLTSGLAMGNLVTPVWQNISCKRL